MLAAQKTSCTLRRPSIRCSDVKLSVRRTERCSSLTCRAVAVGDALPDFKLETDSGAVLSSKDLVRGHGAVLFVYPQACTSGCTAQATAFKDNIRAFADRGYAVYGMSADPPAAQAAWKAQHGFPFPLLSDPSKAALALLGTLTAQGGIQRSHFIAAQGGRLEDVQIGISSKDSVPAALAFVATRGGKS